VARRGPGELLVGPALVAASLPVLNREAARERDPALFWLLLSAEGVKLCGALARHHVAYTVYGGRADAEHYHREGARLAERFRAGELDTGLKSWTGTDFIRLTTGAVYTVIGPTRLGGFLVFSWLGFWGLFLFNRAFALAVPEGRDRTYARLLFFLPSCVFWPSSIGKDSWMIFSLGTGAYGAASALSETGRRGLVVAGLGMWLAALVRPHVAGAMGASLAGSHLLRGQWGRGLVVAAYASLLGVRARRFFRRWSNVATEAGLDSALEDASARTTRGGSRFSPPSGRPRVAASTGPGSRFSPPGPRPGAATPMAAGTVLFRPHVLEAHNLQALLSALESAFLLGLSLRRIAWAGTALRGIRRQPYVAFSLACATLFGAGLSRIGNFGLLSRQRVQLLPFYLVLLSTPPPPRRRASRLGLP
jgi:hypothetical protein